jgi:predicted HTH transcriptional regulator
LARRSGVGEEAAAGFAAQAAGPDLTDTLELHANLLDIPDLVEAFLRKHAFKGADMREWRRQDDWSVPLDILREAVINALIHSDYTQRGGPIRVAFYDDHVYVESLGGLLPGMTVESMRAGMSRIRNQVIARAFREAGMIEQWGYGVQRMFRRAAELGLDEPSYVELPGRLRFIVPTRHAAIMAGAPQGHALAQLHSDSLSPQVSPQVSRRAVEVLTIAAKAPTTRADLLAALGMSNDSKNARRHLDPLLAVGLIAMTDPNSPRSPAQRYWTTDAGLAWLAARQQ